MPCAHHTPATVFLLAETHSPCPSFTSKGGKGKSGRALSLRHRPHWHPQLRPAGLGVCGSCLGMAGLPASGTMCPAGRPRALLTVGTFSLLHTARPFMSAARPALCMRAWGQPGHTMAQPPQAPRSGRDWTGAQWRQRAGVLPERHLSPVPREGARATCSSTDGPPIHCAASHSQGGWVTS